MKTSSPTPDPARDHAVRGGLTTKVLTASVSLLIGLGAAEVAARVWFDAPPNPFREPQLRFERRPEMGWLHVPNQTGYLDDGLASINELGIRGRLPEMPKPSDSLRILALGDSTTFGWGVGDDETYCAFLEERLRAANPARQPHVINAGVSAYDLKNAARLLKYFAADLLPDVVVVGVFWNDLPYQVVTPDGALLAKVTEETPSDQSPRRTSFHLANQPSTLNSLLRRSRLLYVLRQTWLFFIAPTGAASNQVQWEMALLEGRDSTAIDEAWRDIESTLREIRDVSVAHGFDLIVVVMPIRAQAAGRYPNAKYQSRVRAISDNLGVAIVDPLPRFLSQEQSGTLFIPYDRMHFSSSGNALIADAVFEELRKY
jgi:lysophospholipase L1-like esterase